MPVDALRRINTWTDYHSAAVVWALYLASQVFIVVNYGDQEGATFVPWLVVLVATGFFLKWVPSLLIHTVSSIVHTSLGVFEIEIDLGYLRLASGLGIYVFGLVFIGLGRMGRAFHDRTEEQAAQEQARVAAQAQADFKTRFMNMASHELATPLTPVMLQLAALRRSIEATGDEADVRRLDLLERNVDRLARVAKDLLEASRLQAGTMRLEPREVTLGRLVHDAVDSCQDLAREKGVSLQAEAPQDVPVRVDPDRVGQVLFNLTHNALKFTPAGGHVRVRGHVEGHAVVIDIEDDGAGLTTEQQEAVFEPFAQFHRDLASGAGSGLGLYISRGIVEQHHGTLDCISPGPGHGATFTLRIPIRLPDDGAQLDELG